MNKVTEANICLQTSCKKHNTELVDNSNIVKQGLSSKGLHLNPIWTGLFANLKRLGAKMPPPDLTISNQMTMKLGKDIL